MKHSQGLLFGSLFLWLAGSAQPSDNLYFHRLTRNEGLLQTWNWHLLTDSKGYVWISSTIGLNRFDGVSVQTYTPDERVDGALPGVNVGGKFVESPDGDIWFGVDNLLCRYKRNEDRFEPFPVCEWDGDTIVAPCEVVTLDSGGDLWLLAQDVNHHSPFAVFNVRETKNQVARPIARAGLEVNRAHAGLNKAGKVAYLFAYQIYTSTARLFAVDEKKKLSPVDLPFLTDSMHLYDAHFVDDSLLFLLTGEALFKYNLRNRKVKLLLQNPDATCLSYDAYRQGLWLGRIGGYVCFFDLPEFDHPLPTPRFLGKNQLPADIINQIYLDNSGVLWLSYESQGAAWANPSKPKFQTWQVPLPVGETDTLLTQLIKDADGQIWASGKYRLYHIVNSKVEPVFNLPNDVPPFQKIILDRKGRVWWHNANSIGLYDPYSGPQKKALFHKKRRYSEFIDLYPLKNGSIIATSYSGIFEIREPQTGHFTYDSIGILPDTFGYTSAYEDNLRRLYVCQELRQICILKRSGPGWEYASSPIPIRGEVNAWAEDPDYVWIGTSYGLVRVQKTNFQYVVFNQKDGLPSAGITNVQNDGGNGLWLSTYDRLVYFYKGNQPAIVFSRADGVPKDGVNPKNSIAADANGTAWFVTGNRVLIATRRSLTTYKGDAHVLITQILVGDMRDSTLRCAANGSACADDIRFIRRPYDSNTLSFSFVAIEYADPAGNRLEYRMERLDSTWVPTTNPGFARFANLQPGKYRFQVRAFNADGWPGSTIKSIDIDIEPPFWEIWWFRLLVAMLLVASAWGFYRYRIGQIKRIQQMRQQIADDLHDEVGSTLTGIRMFSDSLRIMLRTEQPEATQYLERIGDNAQKTLGAFRDIVWAINPKKDRLADLTERMQEVVGNIGENGHFKCVLSLHLHDPNITLNPRLRHNVYLIFKEALHNAVKHSKATLIELRLETDERHLFFQCTDNGCGFDPKAAPRSTGLFSLEKRAAELKAILSLNAMPGQGTDIQMRLRFRP